MKDLSCLAVWFVVLLVMPNKKTKNTFKMHGEHNLSYLDINISATYQYNLAKKRFNPVKNVN